MLEKAGRRKLQKHDGLSCKFYAECPATPMMDSARETCLELQRVLRSSSSIERWKQFHLPICKQNARYARQARRFRCFRVRDPSSKRFLDTTAHLAYKNKSKNKQNKIRSKSCFRETLNETKLPSVVDDRVKNSRYRMLRRAFTKISLR